MIHLAALSEGSGSWDRTAEAPRNGGDAGRSSSRWEGVRGDGGLADEGVGLPAIEGGGNGGYRPHGAAVVGVGIVEGDAVIAECTCLSATWRESVVDSMSHVIL